MTEAQAKKAIMQYLSLMEKMGRCYCLRNNSFQGKLADKYGRLRWVKQGKTGSPDIIVLTIGGQWVGIETKSSTGKLSDEQIEAKNFIEKLGGRYIEARSIDDVEGLFK